MDNIGSRYTKEQRELFCCYYVMLGDLREAALRSGSSEESAIADGIAMLKGEGVRRKIEELRGLTDSGYVLSGLYRLAFGSSADGVMLTFMEEAPGAEYLRSLDLYGVSEYKHGKNGSEVRFFDRQRALEKLYELKGEIADRKKAAELIEALTGAGEGEAGDEYATAVAEAAIDGDMVEEAGVPEV